MHIYGIYKDSTDEPICRASVESNRFLTMKNEEARQNSIPPCTLTGHYGASGPGPWALGETVE